MLLLYSVARQPIYYPRYLCYTSPAMALLLSVCIVAVVRTRERVTAVLAAFALAATPNYLLVQRGPYAKEGMDFSQVADVITAHASPGDCLILDNTAAWKPGPIRPLTAARPEAYEKLVDPGRGLPAPQRNQLWDAHVAICTVTDRVRQCTVLWTVSERDPAVPERQSGPGLDPGTAAAACTGVSGATAARFPHRRALSVQLRAGGQVHPIARDPTRSGVTRYTWLRKPPRTSFPTLMTWMSWRRPPRAARAVTCT